MRTRNLYITAAAILLIMGSLLGIVLAASQVTDVRVGPTAAIGVATSADGSIVYVVHGNGVFKSTDGGQSWREMPVK